MNRKAAANRNRRPFEDISNTLIDHDESTQEPIEEQDFDDIIVTTPRKRGKLSECDEYEPLPDDGDTCSSLLFSSMDFDETSNSCDYRFPDVIKQPIKSVEEEDLQAAASSSAAGSSKKSVLPSPEFELARFHTPAAVHHDSSFFTPEKKNLTPGGIPFAGFSPGSPEPEIIFSPIAQKNAPEATNTLNAGETAAIVSFIDGPEFQRSKNRRPTPEWRLERSEGEPLSKKQKLAIEKILPEIKLSPKNVRKRAETLFSPQKRAAPNLNIFGATTRTPNRQILTEIPTNSVFSPSEQFRLQPLPIDDFLKLLKGDFSNQPFKKMLIFDCRYQYEFDAARFTNAISADYAGNWRDILKKYTFENELVAKEGNDTVIVFHCEYSKKRGKFEHQWFRRHDREVNRYPKLTFPHVRLLEGGFKSFWEKYNLENAPAGTYATSLPSGIPNYVSEFNKNHVTNQKSSRRAEKKQKRENKMRNQLFFQDGPPSPQPIRIRGLTTPDSCTRSKDRHLRSSVTQWAATPESSNSRNRHAKKNRKSSCKKLF